MPIKSYTVEMPIKSYRRGALLYLRCLGLHVANYCIVYSLYMPYGLLNQSNQDLFTHCHYHCRWLLISPCHNIKQIILPANFYPRQ
jgi:hypothetical protein